MKQTLIRQLRALDDFFFDRVGPIRVLFVVRNILGLGTLSPVIEELMARGGYLFSVTVEFDGCIDETYLADCLWFKEHYIAPEHVVYRKWHYVFTSDYTDLYFRRNTVKVLLAHGNGFGNFDASSEAEYEGKDNHAGHFEGDNPLLLCANSKAMYDLFCRFSPLISQSSPKQVVVSGRPFTDVYFHVDKSEKIKFLEKHSLKPTKKTIVVGSHFREKSLFSTLGLPFIEALCKQNRDCNVIFMGHGRLWDTVAGNKNNEEAYETLVALDESNPNFKFLPKLLDSMQLVNCGDLFVVDNSSFFIECCLVDKPVLFFDHPDFVFGESEVGELYKNASFCFSNLSEVAEVVNTAMKNPDLHAAERKKVKDFFLANQGQATKAVVDLVDNVGRISRPGTKKWRRLEQVCQDSLSNC